MLGTRTDISHLTAKIELLFSRKPVASFRAAKHFPETYPSRKPPIFTNMATSAYPVGMHPALEQPEHFPGLHTVLIADIYYWLSPRLPANYSVSVEQGLKMTDPFDDDQPYRPDIRIDQTASGSQAAAEVAVLSPPAFEVKLTGVNQRFLTIRDADSNLITTLEILSPANKRGSGLDAFVRKQGDLADQGVHLVEIDLLRKGTRRYDERAAAADYLITVQRAETNVASCWPARPGEALPTIPVPLRYPDADVPLPLETVLREFMTKSGLGRRLG